MWEGDAWAVCAGRWGRRVFCVSREVACASGVARVSKLSTGTEGLVPTVRLGLDSSCARFGEMHAVCGFCADIHSCLEVWVKFLIAY